MKIIKRDKWYDPEGLNIEDKKMNVIFEGSVTECVNKILSLQEELVMKFVSRNDIFVNRYYDKKYNLPYLEIYYSSAIAKEIYQIIE